MTVTKLPNILSEAIPKKARDSPCPRNIIPILFTNQTSRQKAIVTAQVRTLMNLGKTQNLPQFSILRTVVFVPTLTMRGVLASALCSAGVKVANVLIYRNLYRGLKNMKGSKLSARKFMVSSPYYQVCALLT